MSATPIRRPGWLAAPLVGALLAVSLLAGCGGGQETPGSYGDGVRRDFVEGCWTTLVRDANGDEALAKERSGLSAAALESKFAAEAKRYKTQCTCVYGKLEDDLDFGDFKKLNDAQTEQPAALEAKVTKIYESCNLGDAPEG
ncbi:MAG: hypothetical protein JWM47_2991 [Acidimicrobiales bacterium]|nr:hypothetical protein [Acidimicrobiales bacterium]